MQRKWLKLALVDQKSGKGYIRAAPALDALKEISTVLQRGGFGLEVPWLPFRSVRLVQGGGDASAKTLARAVLRLKDKKTMEEELYSAIVRRMLGSPKYKPQSPSSDIATFESNALFLARVAQIVGEIPRARLDLEILRKEVAQLVVIDHYHLSEPGSKPLGSSSDYVIARTQSILEVLASVRVIRALLDIAVNVSETSSLLLIKASRIPSEEERFEQIASIERMSREGGMLQGRAFKQERMRIVYLRSRAELRRQWDVTEQPAVSATYTGETMEPIPIGVSCMVRRSEKEDLRLVRQQFPGLYSIATKPTPEQKQERECRHHLKSLVRLLNVHHIPIDFYANLINKGINDFSEIVRKYLASLARVSRPAVDKIEAVAGPVTRAIPRFTRKEDFLDSIRFSATTEAHITASGLTVRDIVYAICKGFDFGKGNGGGAVGNSHYQGMYIRRSISIHCSAAPNKILAYLDSVGLLRRFGSGSKGRAKDNAMSLITGPENSIGKDIMDTMQREFRNLKSGGSAVSTTAL